MTPQCEAVLKQLKKRPMTHLEAERELGILRLAARVKDLRDAGMKIDSRMIEVRTRHGQARVALYSLA